MNLTTKEQTQLDCYKANVKAVETWGAAQVFEDREDRRIYWAGKKLAALLQEEAEVNARKERRADKERDRRAAGKSWNWLPEEYAAAAAIYHKVGRSPQALALMAELLPDRSNAVLGSCAYLDTQNPDNGLKDYASGLLEALQELDADRYCAHAVA